MLRIVGNWKANGTRDSAAALCAALPVPTASVEVVVCPPFPALGAARRALHPQIGLGAQDCSPIDGGAFTGEVTAAMLQDAGCCLAIVGHSERRQHRGETGPDVAAKLRACWRAGLLPLLCVGETAAERDVGGTEGVLRRQVAEALDGAAATAPLWVAYEPVWAIGTGRAAMPADCAAGLDAIRAGLAAAWPGRPPVPCLYGGSVTVANCAGFWEQGGADGALVGGASLQAESFAGIYARAGRGHDHGA